jgi:hypothetical protein
VEKPTRANNATKRVATTAPVSGEIWGDGERPVQARFSNIPYYACAGVTAQVFVLVMFGGMGIVLLSTTLAIRQVSLLTRLRCDLVEFGVGDAPTF